MILSKIIANRIVSISYGYLGTRFSLESFNCVHFVRGVYAAVGVNLPTLDRYDFPPREFHLSQQEFVSMPIGHSVFFKRKEGGCSRPWNHIAIIASKCTLIHCTRYIGNGVVLTPVSVFLETYNLASTAGL